MTATPGGVRPPDRRESPGTRDGWTGNDGRRGGHRPSSSTGKDKEAPFIGGCQPQADGEFVPVPRPASLVLRHVVSQTLRPSVRTGAPPFLRAAFTGDEGRGKGPPRGAGPTESIGSPVPGESTMSIAGSCHTRRAGTEPRPYGVSCKVVRRGRPLCRPTSRPSSSVQPLTVSRTLPGFVALQAHFSSGDAS